MTYYNIYKCTADSQGNVYLPHVFLGCFYPNWFYHRVYMYDWHHPAVCTYCSCTLLLKHDMIRTLLYIYIFIHYIFRCKSYCLTFILKFWTDSYCLWFMKFWHMYIIFVSAVECLRAVRTGVNKSIWEMFGLYMVLSVRFLSMWFVAKCTCVQLTPLF